MLPYLHLHTNVEVDDERVLLAELSAEVAGALGKPESYVMVHLSPRQAMLLPVALRRWPSSN